MPCNQSHIPLSFIVMSSAKIAPQAFVDYVDGHREAFISRLKEAVEIPRFVFPRLNWKTMFLTFV